MVDILFTEWFNENEKRRYPFSDQATLTNGADTILEATFLDAQLYPLGGDAVQYLSLIHI